MVYSEIWSVKRLKNFLNFQLVRFLVVGAGGFAVNFGLLWGLHGFAGLSLLPAQLIAAETAITFNFCLHHTWTYRNYLAQPTLRRFMKFHLSAWMGAGITTLSLLLLVKYAGLNYLFGLAAGGLIAMAWNYGLNTYVIWAKNKTAQTEE